MKKIIFLMVFCQCINLAQAQNLEAKLSPLGLVLGGMQLNLEQTVQQDWGVEAGVITDFNDFTMLNLIGKYYFSPSEKGNDRFHIGVFLNHIFFDSEIESNIGPGLGFYMGYKWLSRRNVIFEIGGGIGRVLGKSIGEDGSFTGTGQLTIGYRFPVIKQTK